MIKWDLLPLIGTANVIKIMVLEINSTLKGIRKHHNDFLGGPKRPFWDGRLRVSTPGYRENYNSIFKQRRNFRRPSK